jgi:glycosyltransferase involved in cell wall biosynthesis
MLKQLPPPPPGKTGWPWTWESEHIPQIKPDGTSWPRISIVTPSFNQGEFLEETIRSIILQNYPNLEYLVIDGGSSDISVEIIKKYEQWITYWVSEKDRSQSHAINKGFERCTGKLVNWICSDDLLCKNALNQFATTYYIDDSFCYIGSCRLIDKAGHPAGATSSQLSTIEELTDLANHWRKNDSIAQQSALYPLAAVIKTGGLTENNHFTMDYELWGNLLLSNVKIKNIPLEIGIYRWYEGQKTSYVLKATNSLVNSALRLISRDHNHSSGKKIRRKISVINYYLGFLYHHFRSFLGIKRRISMLRRNGI